MERLVFRILMTLSLVLLLVIAVAFLLPGATDPTAVPHPEIPLILQSTAGSAVDVFTPWIGFVLELLMVSIIAVCVWIGLRKNGKTTTLNRWMGGAFVVYALLFLVMSITDIWYMQGEKAHFFGGFPVPTAWMIYGIWTFSLVFVAFYASMFNRDILTEADMERFHELVQGMDRKSNDGA